MGPTMQRENIKEEAEQEVITDQNVNNSQILYAFR